MSIWTTVVKAAQQIFPPRKPSNAWAWTPSKQAGVRVSQGNALEIAAVWRAVAYISQSIMTLPWHVHRPDNERKGGEIVRNNLDYVLHTQANAEQSAATWRETMCMYALLWGNSFSEIIRNARGEVQALGMPPHPAWVQVDRDEMGELYYRVFSDRGSYTEIPYRNMYHLRGMGDGVEGMSVIRYASRSLGIAAAQDENVGAFFGNGSRASGVLTHPGQLGKDGRENLTKYVQENLKGPKRAHNMLVLEEGMSWKQMGVPNEDAQLLESRQFSVQEIARWYGLPPHVLMDYGRATWSNLEQASTDAVRSGLMPWIVKLEQEADAKLIGRRSLNTIINLKGLLRADTSTRNQAYALGRQWGWLSANEIRQWEDLPPYPGGDNYLIPLNMMVVGDEERPSIEAPLAHGQKILLRDVCARIIAREINQIKRYGARDDFDDWFKGWLPKQRSYALDALGPIAQAYHLAFGSGVDVAALVEDYIDGIRDSVMIAHQNSDLGGYCEAQTAFIDTLTEEWARAIEG